MAKTPTINSIGVIELPRGLSPRLEAGRVCPHMASVPKHERVQRHVRDRCFDVMPKRCSQNTKNRSTPRSAGYRPTQCLGMARLERSGVDPPCGNRALGILTRTSLSVRHPYQYGLAHSCFAKSPVGQREQGRTGAPTKHPVFGDVSAPSCTFSAADVEQS